MGNGVTLILALLGFSSVLSNPLEAAPTCDALKTEWDARYTQEFKIDWTPAAFTCPGGQSDLALALYDLQATIYNPNKDGYRPEFYSLVKGLAKIIQFDETCDSLALAYQDEGKIKLCSPYFKDSREDRASTLVHESRHLQADDPVHVKCVGGKHNGDVDACDAVFYDGAWEGSGYNADVNFYGWNLNGTDKNELSRSVMQSAVNALVPDRFNQITGALTKQWREN